jgi:predicted TIM-barrel fold metal-dependent hydrolase
MTNPAEALDRLQIVDAHQHFWNLQQNYYPWLCDAEQIPFRYGDYSILRQTYLPADFRRDAGPIQVVKTVHIEAEWDPKDPVGETRWISGIAAAHGLPSACVAQAWLDRDDVAEVLAAQAEFPLVRGIRHKPRAAASPAEAKRGAEGSMDDPRWRKGYALLEQHKMSFDLQTPWWHFDAAAELARDFPRTQIIINHTGLPSDRSAEGLAGWRRGLEQVAAQPNVALKISGLGRKGLPWTVEANGPVIRDAIAIFGTDRCMFASNYPVDKLAGAYTDIFAGFAAAVADRPVEDRRKLFHDNAVRIYRL